MITKHPNEIPEGFTPMRYLYGQITGKYKGKCMYCSNETEWNEATGKYGRICGSITCRDMYAENHQLLSPEKQREMLAKRKISSVYDFNGTELYYTGTYEYKFLEFMKNVMQWSASDIMAPSPNTYYYEYKNPNDEYHEGMRFYIPDFYIPSLNLEIEIKDQTTTHPKFLKIDKVKEDCKDKKMHELRNKVNYFKINDNDFRPFMKYLEDMKLSFSDKELLDKRLQRAASVINEVDIREGRKLLDVATEAYNGSTLTIDQAKAILTSKAKATLRIPEVEVDEKDIHIKNLYVEGLFRRIYNHYSSKSMRNVFAIEYDPASLERYKNKRITKAQLKVKEIHAPLFFALELYEIFSELGAKYNDAVYTRIANDIHSSTWLSNAEKTNVAPMNLNPLNDLTLSLLPHQRDFIMNYPKLKASLGLNGYILAFDQGLGKTLTAIALAECGQYEHVYIVCPNALMDNWALEIRKYYKKYENQKTYEKEVVLCKSRNANRNGRFFIINNEALNLMDPFIHNTKNILIVDECHNFRNIDRKRSQGLIELQSKIKPVDTLLLSGTPIKAAPSEITPSLRLIDPLMTDEAASMYTKAFKIDNTSAAGIITKRFNRAIYRKDKSVLEGLPKKVIKESFLKVSDSDKYLVKNVTRQILELYAEVYKEHCLNDAENRETLKYYVNKYGRNCEGYNEYMKWIDTHHENVMVEFHDYEKDLIRGFLKKNIYPKLKNDDEYQKLRHIEKTLSRFNFCN